MAIIIRPGAEPRPRTSCVFWGRLDFDPNVDALEWFIGKVWPAVGRETGGAASRCSGSTRARVRELAKAPGVRASRGPAGPAGRGDAAAGGGAAVRERRRDQEQAAGGGGPGDAVACAAAVAVRHEGQAGGAGGEYSGHGSGRRLVELWANRRGRRSLARPRRGSGWSRMPLRGPRPPNCGRPDLTSSRRTHDRRWDETFMLVCCDVPGDGGLVRLSPVYGISVYYLFVVLRPQFIWEWVQVRQVESRSANLTGR